MIKNIQLIFDRAKDPTNVLGLRFLTINGVILWYLCMAEVAEVFENSRKLKNGGNCWSKRPIGHMPRIIDY